MSNSYFQFKQFTIHQDRCAMKVTTDGCLFGAWAAERVGSRELGVGSLLDIGTGTGLLTLMIAQKNPEVDVDAIEIDEDTAKQATENIAASPWNEKIKVHHADAKIFSYSKKYDCIISNPPFYENELKADVSKKNIAHHDEGLLLPELLSIIKNNLKADGQFYLLLPYKRNDEIRRLVIENELEITELVFVRQTVTHDFFRILLSGKLKGETLTETKIHEIAIKDEEQQYSPAFVSLLKDYYLHL
jgi:tRNA1Val (adenine37-N6)-methyltransferase